MGRRVQQLDTLENVLYVLLSLLLIAVGVLSLVKGTLHYVYLIFGGGALYYLIGAVGEYVRGGEGAVKRGGRKLIWTLLLAAFTYASKVCL